MVMSKVWQGLREFHAPVEWGMIMVIAVMTGYLLCQAGGCSCG